MINYIAWIQLFVLALKLFPTFNSVDNVQVKTSWKSLESFGMFAKVRAMQVEFMMVEQNKPLITYLLIPWENISIIGNEADISSMLGMPDLLCVTPFAIVQERCTIDSGEEDVVLKEKITNFIEELFNVDVNLKLLVYEDGFSLGDQYQVITKRQFPYLVDLSIATPGSTHLDQEFFTSTYNNTMIFVSMIPDMGSITASWIKSGDAEVLQSIIPIQDEMIRAYEGYINTASTIKDIDKRVEFYEKCKVELIDYLELKGVDTTTHQFYIDLLMRFLFVPGEQTKEIQMDSVFGYYQPKTTSDTAADYMTGISDDIAKLPEAQLNNLHDLIMLFDEQKVKATEMPGKIVEGNMLLGGLPEEYQASKDELLLAEIGEKIRKIIASSSGSELNNYCSTNDLSGKEFVYTKFSFIHYDVMGSGRYFYISSRDTVHLVLP
ncbi:MAG: hypothetical protein JW794_10480 [Candidatus Cloacimonetes bacterium]|nr:hypothetical protein [Candidatus Cloacimonadota bacterium]